MNGVNKQELDTLAETNPYGLIKDDAKFRLWVMMQFEEVRHTITDPKECPIGRKLNWMIGVLLGAPAFLLALAGLLRVLMK